MKKLILYLILISNLAFAQNEMQDHDKKVETKFLTVVKDVEVDKLLGASAELNKCRDKNKFGDAAKDLAAATACFKTTLPKDEAALKKLSADLKLEEYGVIRSKNVSAITEYLAKRFHKALTGKDPDKQTAEDLKWKNQKIIDQKVFIELYKNQLAKNALFEISRYCFENLRLMTTPTTATDFSSYWSSSFDNATPKKAKITDTDVTDVGDVGDANKFFAGKIGAVDLNDEKVVYEKLISGLTPGTTPVDSALFGAFFTFCQTTIKPLCDDFKSRASSQPAGSTTAPAPGTATLSRGSAACLTFNKLEAIRTTLRNTEKVAKQFVEMEDKGAFAIQMIENPQIYQGGKGAGEESYDELTSVASTDLLQDNDAENDRLAKLETECLTNTSSKDCEDFLQVNEGLDKAINNLETNIELKKEIEVARVKQLNGQSLKDYLKENRHFDLLERLDKQGPDGLTDADIEREIKAFYDAKRIAESEALRFKVGKRQANATDAGTDANKATMRNKNITDSKEERARLAQVVMFNNIITSQLDLQKQTGANTYESVGRNVSGWNKEKAGLDQYGIQQGVFSGIQNTADSAPKTKESIADVGFLDSILGKDTSKEEFAP
jgi:hypothetical protein